MYVSQSDPEELSDPQLNHLIVLYLAFKSGTIPRLHPPRLGGGFQIEGISIMTSLLLGFIGIVVLPILIMSVVMSRWARPGSDRGFQEDELRFTISSDNKS